jgi:hypothetical protein
LKFADLLQRFLKLAGEARAVEAESGESAVQFSHVEVDIPASVTEQIGFEGRDPVQAPGSIGEFLSELSFGGRGGLVFI